MDELDIGNKGKEGKKNWPKYVVSPSKLFKHHMIHLVFRAKSL